MTPATWTPFWRTTHRGPGWARVLVTGSLCRDLCRNPSIPTHLGRCRCGPLGYRCRVGNSGQTRMNTAHPHHSLLLSLIRLLHLQRTVTAEAAGSSPVVPAIHSKEVASTSAKPSRTQKGRAWRPCRVLFALYSFATWRQLLAS